MNITILHKQTLWLSIALLATSYFTQPTYAQKKPNAHQIMSVSTPEIDNTTATELASFEMAPGYQANLFASEEDGIANPVTMRWGPKGRLWVLCSNAYPQIVPTALANDKLYILEDTDGDGRSDKTIIYADGLDMPMGFALGDGGVYVAQGQNLIFLQDTDGDDHADQRRTLFSGFGTGDTHQNINSLTWSPGGELLFCQGLHCFSRVETPWGIVRLNEHGVWRLRPRRRQLHAFRGGSGQNPWGIAFGAWGQPFAKGNSAAFSELLPIMIPTDKIHPPLDIGQTSIKSMIAEIIDSTALPADIQGDVLIAGYFGRLIHRLKLTSQNSGHTTQNQPPLMRTDHASFRPVDIRTGPDGALYIADWYNPIIGHYQASFRHPNRDKTHGRIWRITSNTNNLLTPIDLTTLTIPQLLDQLKNANLSEQNRIRAHLSDHPTSQVIPHVDAWTAKLDPANPNYENYLFHALTILEWHETPRPDLLTQLLNAKNPLARAYATRIVGRWADRLQNPSALLATAIKDSHPRVRLEAIVAASYIQQPQSIALITQALDQPADRFIQAAMMQATHALAPSWWPALLDGSLAFTNPKHLTYALQYAPGENTNQPLRDLLKTADLTPALKTQVMALLATKATPTDLTWLLTHANKNATVLNAIANTASLRNVKPAQSPDTLLTTLIQSDQPNLQRPALKLLASWNIKSESSLAKNIALDKSHPLTIRTTALQTFSHLQKNAAINTLINFANNAEFKLRHQAIASLTLIDINQAAALASKQILQSNTTDQTKALILPFLNRKNGLDALTSSLSKQTLSPELTQRILSILGAAGRQSTALHNLDSTSPTVGLPNYSQNYVNQLTTEVLKTGNPANGEKVYQSAALSCIACHKIDNTGGTLGPQLTAVGSGLPVELIIEATLWPKRQIKEGFVSTTLTTKTGQLLTGYIKAENKKTITLQDITTSQTHTLSVAQITSLQGAGTIMPPGLTAGLTRTELRDLICYLSELKGP